MPFKIGHDERGERTEASRDETSYQISFISLTYFSKHYERDALCENCRESFVEQLQGRAGRAFSIQVRLCFMRGVSRRV